AQRRSAGASAVPGRRAIRLPVSPPSAAPAPSKLTSAPSPPSSRASRAAIRPSRREWLSIWTSSRKSDFKRAGSITSGGHYHGDPLVARRAGTYRHARGGRGRDPDRRRGGARVGGRRAARRGGVAGHAPRPPGAHGRGRRGQAAAARWAAELAAAGIPARLAGMLMAEVWAKVLCKAALIPRGALLGVPYGDLPADRDTRMIMDAVIEEAFAVARAEGVELAWPDAAAYRDVFYGRLVPSTAAHRPSMLQDIERGRPTEIDAINGPV